MTNVRLMCLHDSATTADCEIVGRVTINTLPDEVLLLIFRSDRLIYLDELRYFSRARSVFWKWHRLSHVCRRWRSVVFGSPSFLGLRLVCRPRTPIQLAGIWPPLPIIVTNYLRTDRPMPEDYDFDAAIIHPDRVCEIHLVFLTSSQLQRLASARQEQFPALVHLTLHFKDNLNGPARPAPALPDWFLGGFTPRLESLELNSIPFPALPKLLLSATDLVRLTLQHIPHSGYFSPEAIVTALAVLANLTYFIIEFESPLSRPDLLEIRLPLPPTRIALPALTRFQFQGASEYLDDVVARIDAPLLDTIWITFFHQLTFDISQLARFMRRTPRLQGFNGAHVDFDDSGVQIGSLPLRRPLEDKSRLRISCTKMNRQLSSLAQVLTSFFSSIDTVEHLYIYRPRNLPLQWQDDIENGQWLEIFRPFTAVTNLFVCKEFAHCIAPALQELVRERVVVVLPALENLFLEELQPSGPVQEAIGQFVAARRLLGHPVAVSNWR
jgi:hypothetical protein